MGARLKRYGTRAFVAVVAVCAALAPAALAAVGAVSTAEGGGAGGRGAAAADLMPVSGAEGRPTRSEPDARCVSSRSRDFLRPPVRLRRPSPAP